MLVLSVMKGGGDGNILATNSPPLVLVWEPHFPWGLEENGGD